LSEEKKYKNYTAADIEKYHKGLLSPGEMNEMEKAALDDPFLADALEGYGATTVNVSSDLSELEKKLEERISDKKLISIAPSGSMFKWWKVAAAIIILGGLGYFVFQISTGNKSSREVAITVEDKKPSTPGSSAVIDSNKSAAMESTGVAATSKQPETATKHNPGKKKEETTNAVVEANRDDVAVEITKPSQRAENYQQPEDSVSAARISGVSAPIAMEKRPAAAAEKQNEGYLSSKKEAVSNNRRANYFNGRVKDANNNPLPFANITITRDSVGTYADAQGRFTLVSPDSVINVQVRSVGFENNMVQLKNSVASNDVVLQEDKSTPDKVLSIQKPDTSLSRMANIKFEELEPADGWNNYNTYLANNINIPEDIKRRDEVKGQVQLSFEVNQEGSPINIRVEKSLCGKCDEEAVRVVKQGPKWKKKNKKAKRITISVPFDTEQ
jgi:TonB family protein